MHGCKEFAQNRNVAEKWNFLKIVRFAIIEQTANDEALSIGQFNFRLDAPDGEGRDRSATNVD